LNHGCIDALVCPAERWKGVDMECPICIDLARAFEAGLSEYLEARSSACYQVSKRFAAKKKVDMERAKYALEEHQCVCVSTVRVHTLLSQGGVSTSLIRLEA
jgi:hypothetical protein